MSDARLKSTIEDLADALQVLVLSIEAAMRETARCRNCEKLGPVTSRALEAARDAASALRSSLRNTGTPPNSTQGMVERTSNVEPRTQNGST